MRTKCLNDDTVIDSQVISKSKLYDTLTLTDPYPLFTDLNTRDEHRMLFITTNLKKKHADASVTNT